MQDNLVHPGRRSRRDPANVHRHERAQATNFAEHLAAMHGIDPHCRAVDRRCRWPQAREPQAGAPYQKESRCTIGDSADLLGARVRWSWNVHTDSGWRFTRSAGRPWSRLWWLAAPGGSTRAAPQGPEQRSQRRMLPDRLPSQSPTQSR